MKHRIVTEDQNDEDVIEWKLQARLDGDLTLLAKRGATWRAIAKIYTSGSMSVDKEELRRIGLSFYALDTLSFY